MSQGRLILTVPSMVATTRNDLARKYRTIIKEVFDITLDSHCRYPHLEFIMTPNQYYRFVLAMKREQLLPVWLTDVKDYKKPELHTTIFNASSYYGNTTDSKAPREDHELIEFSITDNDVYSGGNKLRVIMREVFALTLGIPLGNNITARTIHCRPSQFADFLIRRNEAGLKNGFKNLKPRYLTKNELTTNIFYCVTKGPIT